MKKILVLMTAGMALLGIARGQDGTLLTNAVVVVTPTTLDFGTVAARTTVTNTLLVENAGEAKLVGKATVAPPFKIIEGARYSLKANEAQMLTITYTPTKAERDTRTVYFTGGFGAKVTVTGQRAVPPPNSPGQR